MTMRAVAIRGHGGPEVLEFGTWPHPMPKPGEAVVAIRAAAVNPADGKWRAGMFAGFAPVSFPHILGYDVAGVVVGGAGLTPGTRVAAMLDPFTKGGYADYVAVAADRLVAIPDGLSFEVAAAVPTAGLTGAQLIERAVDARPGQFVLLTGAVGAVGRFALDAARRRGVEVVAAVRGTRKDEALALGAAQAIALGEEDWRGPSFDHVVDTVGGDAVAALCRHLRPGGRIATAATTPIDPQGLAATPEFYAVVADTERLGRLLDAVAKGEIAVPIARVMPLEEAAEAQRLTDAGGTGGKIILTP
ncbi:NADP-dependent oxidoreductase [Rhizorhabdus wittichii]|uniref:NADP-dependent oxidoreductase n=1 Tax=Rhizorhabdus wittichii TaxID=160791 RepID=UPI0002EF5789|nr:NADP-dependent oxidoreductase [Rhizorhabdus wittichii]